MAKKKSSFFKKIIISFFVLLVLATSIGGYFAYQSIYQSNVNLGDKKSQIIYIPTGSTFSDVLKILSENSILANKTSFEWLAEKKNYKSAVKAGKYRILANMSNNALINLLRAGIQEPIEINFNGLKTTNQLIARVAKRIEADSLDLYYAFNDNAFLSKYGFNKNNVQALFLPNTYQFYWNTSVDEFFERMATEYKKYWTEERIQKAKKIKLTQVEVSTLASIVQSEQCCDTEEQKTIAGLYLNRLKMGMKLQSDPTVIFAIGDFSDRRVSYEELKFNSPYNTYIINGLPPGPIGFANTKALDAVLNFEKHDYIFMCAKEDLSGKHYFAKTAAQHEIYAKKYRDALNKRNIH